jgi:hypothetical protein
MNVKLTIPKDYAKQAASGGTKNKAKRRPLAGNSKHEYRNPKQKHLTENDLKKQTQFPRAKKDVNSCAHEAYDNESHSGSRKNKPNLPRRDQSQFRDKAAAGTPAHWPEAPDFLSIRWRKAVEY